MIKPLVSIILPTYNGKREWISQTIDSVINQTYSDRELIIINDGSTNNIEETILEYTDKERRIRYFKNKRNMEKSYSKNKCILESRWKYIAIIDDDDIWSDYSKLQKQIEFLEENEDYGLCGCSVNIVNENWEFERKEIMREDNIAIKNTLLQFNQIAQSSAVIRKEILALSWLFLQSRALCEDAELRLRIGKYTKLHNLHSTSINYRRRGWSCSNRNQVKIQLYGLRAMIIHRSGYPNFLKWLVLRLWLIILTIFWIEYKK